MKKTSFVSTAMVLLFAVASIAGCGGDKSACGPDNDLVPNLIPNPDDLNTFWVGSLVIDEVQRVGFGAEHNTLVAANFYDFSDYQVQLADRVDLPDYPACTVYVSRQITTGTPVALGVTRVTFGGLAGGDVLLEPDEFDHLEPDLLPQRGFESEQVSLSIESPDGETDFPAFDDVIAAAPPPELFSIDKEPVELASGPSLGITTDRVEDMRIQWRPGGADFVEFKLIPGSGSETPWGKLRCVTFDDGCLVIPADLIAYLAADTATNFELRLEHHNYVLHSIKEGGETKAAATIDSSSTLAGTVTR